MSAATPPSANDHDVEADTPVAHGPAVEAFFSNLTDAQSRFVRSFADATAWLDGDEAELGQFAALHARLTQQIFDAQRSILRKRADTGATAIKVRRSAEFEAATLVESALAEAAELCADLDEVTAFGDVLAMRRDGREPSPPELIEAVALGGDRRSDNAERQLQALLDEWWQVEIGRARGVLDDEQARASVRLHLARIEAGEILETARAVNAARNAGGGEPATDEQHDATNAMPDLRPPEPSPHPTRPASAPPVLLDFDAALDLAPLAGLDALLASFLDVLRDPPADVTTSVADADGNEAGNGEGPPASGLTGPLAVLPSQDAFDRFWGSGHGRTAERGTREWFFVQMLLPMAAVVAVLALVLAWIG